MAEVSLETLSSPPRGVRIEKEFLKPTVITYRRLSPALFFLIPFTAMWSGISMFGAMLKEEAKMFIAAAITREAKGG